MVLLRITKILKDNGILLWPLYIFFRLLLKHYEYKFGICIPYNTKIAPGFYIGHYGGIVINSEVKIGENCNINHGVTIGISYGGKNPGTPTILNNVYLGPGSKIIGGITIGNNVAIGANTVVVKDIPDNAVIVGSPEKVISYKGSSAYVVNTI